ncbi:hypothetical protein SDC9_160059 [bioreactor metagenome]|uniref:Tetratricopeptide repeat protein n=1 Tax=bioreactor metagenome TaxID=1076179 RepID=A0A645FHB8_9ZZZZ
MGYCLLKKKDINQALNLFKQLAGDLDDLNELIEKIHFCYAFALLSLGKKREASIIADDLYMKYRFGNTKVIGVFELMDLYYSLEEYQKVNKMFEDKYRDSNGNEYSLSFFGEEIQVILYTLHTLGFNEKCKVVFESKIQEIKDTIENYETDDIYSKEIIAYFENEMLELKNGYYSIIDFDKRPEISDITKNLKVEPYCYLIDCPRHINNFK